MNRGGEAPNPKRPLQPPIPRSSQLFVLYLMGPQTPETCLRMNLCSLSHVFNEQFFLLPIPSPQPLYYEYPNPAFF